MQYSSSSSSMDQYYHDSVFGVGHSSSSSSSYVDSNYIMQQQSPTNTIGLYSSNIQPQNTIYNFTINADSHSHSQGSNDIFESMNRGTPYTPEEKKERIERYRSKRNLRNFNKKIKYECRKTLADSRPRVRGRFARNIIDDSHREKAAAAAAAAHHHHDQRQWEYSPFLVEDDQDYYSWINILDALNKSQISSF